MLDTVGGGGMSDAYQVLMRRFRAAAPAAATPPTGYIHSLYPANPDAFMGDGEAGSGLPSNTL